MSPLQACRFTNVQAAPREHHHAAPMLVLILGGLLAWVPTAGADGFMILRPVPGLPDPEALAVRYHDVDISVRDQVAAVAIDQVFLNLNDREVGGEYIFPIPDGAAVSDFALYVDGTPVHAEAMDAKQALRIYQDLVRENLDPALLEYAGREMFRARIHPFAPHGERRVKLEYDQIIERSGGLYRFVYPLSTEKFSSRPLERAVVTLDLEADRPIRNAYCPTHAVEVRYLDERHVRVSWEESGTKPDRDMVFYYALAEGPMDIRLVPHRSDRGEDGYFMLLASMGQDDRVPVTPKDVVLVVDRSGSMNGAKLDQARHALRYCLEHLNPEDRFNVVTFASAVDAFADGLQPASRERVAEAVRFVKSTEAGGSTNIAEALRTALDARFSRKRPAFVVFVTDGLPTTGEENLERILDLVRDWNEGNGGRPAARLFSFGIGYDVNAVLLDLLAEQNAGRPTYVRPGEDLRSRIEGFYDQIADPVMTDLELTVDGARLLDLQPPVLPDIYRGSQLVLFGRYRGEGRITVSLRGTVEGRRRTFRADAELPALAAREEFVGRLWATRKVGALLRNVRLHGERAELVDEIRDLGLRFGIVTPYTSFLVDEDAIMAREQPVERRYYPEWVGGGSPGARGVQVSGSREAWEAAQGGPSWGNVHALYDGAEHDAAPDPAGAPGARKKAPSMQVATGELGVALSDEVESLASANTDRDIDRQLGVRRVAGRTFHREAEVWKEVGYQDGDPTSLLEVGSDAYFALLSDHPELGAVLSLGERVIFQVGGRWYETHPAG